MEKGKIIQMPKRDTPKEDIDVDFEQDRADIERLTECIREERYKEGLEIARKLINEEPQNVTYLNYLGQIYIGMGRKSEAIEIFNNACRLDRSNIDVLFGLIRSKMLGSIESSDYDSVIELFEECLKIEPENLMINLTYANFLYMKKRDTQKTLELYKKCAEMMRKNGSKNKRLIEEIENRKKELTGGLFLVK